MTSASPLSVAIITLNEGENIRACLESVAWAGEIVVIDGGSKDKTVDICREFNCRIIQKEWLGFGRQKNFALDQCSYDWVLNIDADERLTPELQNEIRQLTANSSPAFNGYYIARQNFFLGKWIKYGGWYPDYNLRLFNRHKGRFNERQVHEAVQLEGESGYLTNPLQHYTYKSLADYYRRMERYSNLAAQQMHEEGRKAGIPGLLLHPLAAFFRMYFFKQGFKDGYDGLVLAGLYTSYTFAKYAKLWELQRN